MRKNTQKIACYILIPMLVFTFIVTIYSEKNIYNDVAQNVIIQYFNYRNNNDIDSIASLLANKDDLDIIESESKYLKDIKLIDIEEEENESIKKAYIKNNKVLDTNVKIYKVKYEVIYDSNSKLSDKSGTYINWYFLVNTYSNNWLIDVGII